MPQTPQTIKNGSVKGKPKRLCKSYGYNFVAFRIKGVDVKIKPKTLLLYLCGVSIRRVAALSDSDCVNQDIRKGFGTTSRAPGEDGLVLELDETRGTHIEKKIKNLWVWRMYRRNSSHPVD